MMRKTRTTVCLFGFFIALMSVCAAIVLFQGCEKTEPTQADDWLIRVEASHLTVDEFKKALEIARIAYPYEMFKPSETGEPEDPQSEEDNKNWNVYREKQLQVMRTRLLSELTERLILHERARELNISVTDAELDLEISKVKKSYPEDEFEKSLLESAISFDLWKKQLRDRMLMEKVISKDLRDEIEITSEELQKYYHKLVGGDSKPGPGNPKNENDTQKSKTMSREIEEKIMEQIRAGKVEKAYPGWIQNLKQRYDIEINQEQWKKIESA